MENEDDFFLPTWAYEHTVYEKKTQRETVLSYEEDETQLPEELEIIATSELVRRKDLPDKWRCSCGAEFFWDRNHEEEQATCPDCASTDTELIRESETGGDRLAELAHRLWTYWSQHIAEEEDISQDRLERWEDLWIPYLDLSEESQEKDQELVQRFISEKPDYRDIEGDASK